MEPMPASTYREWPELSPRSAVCCRWEQHVTALSDGLLQRVLPDGCADIVVTDSGEAVVVGPTTGVAMALLGPGSTLRGIRFRTAAIAGALGAPGSEFRNRAAPLDGLFGRCDAAETAEVIWAGRTPGWASRAHVDPRVRLVVGRLWGSPQADITAVAAVIGLSGRQLRRLLLAQTGLGPKTLYRVGRLHRFLRLAEGAARFEGLAAQAARAGFADQAHLTRDVRDLAGTTPALLLAERSGAAG